MSSSSENRLECNCEEKPGPLIVSKEEKKEADTKVCGTKNEEKNLILSQWQVCVEMANATSQRRDAMNNLFVTLNLAVIAAVSVVWDVKTLLLLTAGVVLCVLWLLFIQNFRLLNTEKFNVINTIENQLPATPFNDEWSKLKENKKYRDGTKLEKVLPVMFIILYSATAIIIVLENS